VLINSKRPTSKTEPLGDVLGRIPVAAVERIEVINGGASGIDMQGYPTIANVVLADRSGGSLHHGVQHGDAGRQPAADARRQLQPEARRQEHQRHGGLAARPIPAWAPAPAPRSMPTARAEVTVSGSGINESKTVKLNYGQDLLDGQLTVNGAVNPWTYQSQIHFDGAAPSVNLNDNGGRTVEQGLAYTRDLSPGTSIDLKLLHRSAEAGSDWGNVTSGGTAHSVSTTSASEQVAAGQLTWQVRDGVVIRGGIERTLNANDASNTWQGNGQATPTPGVGAWIRNRAPKANCRRRGRSTALNAEAGLRHRTFQPEHQRRPAGRQVLSVSETAPAPVAVAVAGIAAAPAAGARSQPVLLLRQCRLLRHGRQDAARRPARPGAGQDLAVRRRG
jgi:hypothetical protein